MTTSRRIRPTAHTGRETARKLTTDRSYLRALRQRVAARTDLWDRAMHGDAEALIALGRLVLDQHDDDNTDTAAQPQKEKDR